jgi:hypothetical protein
MNHVFDNLNEFSSFFNEKFQTRSGSKEASPDRFICICIRVEITFFDNIIFLFLLVADFLDVLGRGTILESNIIDILMSIDILDYSIPSFEVFIGVLISEIFSDCVEKDVRSVVLTHFLKVVCELVASELDIKDGNNGVFSVAFSVEVLRRGIMEILNVSE